MIKKIMFSVISFLFVLNLVGCTANQTSEKLDVKVQVWALQYLVEEIGKEDVNVSLAVASGDAHHKEPTQKEVAALAKSALFFYIGSGDVGVEAESLLKTTESSQTKTIDLAQSADLLQVGSETDPHIWLSPKQMMKMAEQVKQALIDQKGDKKSAFETNYAALNEKLKAVDAELQTIFANKTNQSILIEHAAYGYMARDYGFKQHSLTQTHEGHDHEDDRAHEESGGSNESSEFSAAQIETLKQEVKERQWKYLYADSQSQSESVAKVAAELGLEVQKVSTLETPAQSGTNQSYVEEIKKIAEVFVKEME